MAGWRHPLREQTYELLDDGNVKVVDLVSGGFGVFRSDDCPGVEGELRFAAWHYVRWVGGRKVAGGLF